MSAEEYKAMAHRFVTEVWGKGNLDVVNEFLAPDFVLHNPPPGIAPDREGYKQWVSMVSGAWADTECTVEDVIAEGDKVVTRWTWSGTHKGEIWGIPPTGKRVTITGISIDRIVDGKDVEEWGEMDMMGMMQQLGVVPSPGQAEE